MSKPTNRRKKDLSISTKEEEKTGFAPGQYEELTNQQKLSNTPFEPFNSGKILEAQAEIEEIKALVRHQVEETNKGKTAVMAVIDELYDSNIILHCPHGKDICGIKDYKQAAEETFRDIPDNYSTIDDMIVEGDKVAMRLTMTGTYVGKVGVTCSTNKKVTISQIIIDRIAGGKFVEEWIRYDTYDFMQQLGIIPKQGKD